MATFRDRNAEFLTTLIEFRKKDDIKLAAHSASVYFLVIAMSASTGRQNDSEDKETGLHTISSIEEGKTLEGIEVGLSDWIVIDQNRIDQFAEATNDYQWIHVDIERAAKEMPDGKTIAHGYMILALIPALTGKFVHVENLARAINFGVNKVRFYSAVPVGARVRARATVHKAQRRAGALFLTSEVRIEVEGVKKPTCVAETLAMYFFND